MSNHEVISKFQAHLKALYQRAIDADQKLDALGQQGLSQFSAIIKDPSLFKTQADRFQPYIFELAEKVSQLETDLSASQVNLVLRCMQELTQLLEQFKATTQAPSKAKAPTSL